MPALNAVAPTDFTFVCPTEIRGFEARAKKFKGCGCQVLAISIDDVASHKAWSEELGGVSYPLLSDPARETCRAYGVLNDADGRAFRATFIISPEGRIAWALVSLKELQTGRLCPADWRPGEPTLDPELKY